MGFSITMLVLGLAVIVTVGAVYFLLKSRSDELRRMAAELQEWFASDLEVNHIAPSDDWPIWARNSYIRYYEEYQKVFERCSYRMKHPVYSITTLKSLSDNFYRLHKEQQNLKQLVYLIEKYRKVPQMKSSLQKRFDDVRGRFDQLPDGTPLKSFFNGKSQMLARIQTDDQETFPHVFMNLGYLERDLQDFVNQLDQMQQPKMA